MKEYDIVKVEREGQVIYEREDIREMTVEEISKALGYEVKVFTSLTSMIFSILIS